MKNDKDTYKLLRESFLCYLQDKGITVFQYTFLREWFLECKLKQGEKFGYGYSANLHRLIIRELQKQGRIVKINKNLWQVVSNPLVHQMHNEIFSLKLKNSTIEDEFDKYLREKINKE